MSEKIQREKGGGDSSNSDLPLTRDQMLAIMWSGLEPLWKAGQAHIYNNADTKTVRIEIANALIVERNGKVLADVEAE